MSAIGSQLKEARTKKSLTLEEVHAKLKIHPRVLRLIEEERFDKLPSPLFARSFLKSYAEFLEVDPAPMLESYDRENRRDPEQVIFIKPINPDRKPPLVPRALLRRLVWTVAGIGFLLGLSLAGAGLVRNVPRWIPKPASPSKKTAAPAVSKPAPAPPAKPKGAEWLRSPEQGNFPRLSRQQSLQLKIAALDNVWMRVTCDDKVLFQAILKKGSSETWTATRRVEIWTGNSSAMALTLNGSALGSPGKGVVKKLVIDHEGVRILS